MNALFSFFFRAWVPTLFLLTFHPLPGQIAAGLYVGTFSGQEMGDFVVAVDGYTAYVALYNESSGESYATSTTVDTSGRFNVWVGNGTASGRFSQTGLSGTAPGVTFTARRVRPEGVHGSRAGFFTGTFSGSIEGEVYAALLPDGRFWFLSESRYGSEGGKGRLSFNGDLSTTSYLGTRISGSGSGNRLSGTWRGSGGQGTFQATKRIGLSSFLDLVPFATEKRSGSWGKSPWLGWFAEIAYPYIWHQDHGWWYILGGDPFGTWVYERHLGSCYLSEWQYPWLYSSGKGKWLYYERGTNAPRWFRDGPGWLEIPRG
ncbi:MAG: hypothetical protein GVY10_10345 [Verrucomicrobia bacterium]|jgi:hypothetical protein|nr:hypothetical protein [Verrucomicrobiota bacterium]